MNQTDSVHFHCVSLISGPRRLPVYFILDFSGGPQSGFAGVAARQIQGVIGQLESFAIDKRDDFQSAPAFYTVIVFRQNALQFHPLAPPGVYRFEDLRLDEIEPQGNPGFAAAVAALEESVEHELKMPGMDNGDNAPLIFLFTEKSPGEKWTMTADRRLFVCGSGAIPKNTPSPPADQLEFLPLECQAQIFHQIETARDKLKKDQQMMDYPTEY
jgi:hypothetical protein